MNDKKMILTRALGRTDVIALGFGTIVGWSWIIMAASWITDAGFFGAILAFLIGGGFILLVGLLYGELTSALPLAGGEFVFAYRAFGKRPAFFAGWIMTLAYLGVAAWESIAFATALDYIFPIPKAVALWEIAGYQVNLSWVVVGSAMALVMMIINLLSIRPAVLFQVIATMAIFILVLFIFFGALAFGDPDNIGDKFTDGNGFFHVLFLIPAMLIGFDVIPQSAEELNIKNKDIGKMIIVCILVSIAWYCILIVGIGIAVPSEIRLSADLPIAEIAAYLFNDNIFVYVVVIGGLLGILTTWNGFFMGATRLIFAMSRAGVLPKAFSRLNKNNVPWVAVVSVGGLCMVSPFLGRNGLDWLVSTSSICSLAAFAFVSLAMVRLRKKEPDLHRDFEVPHGYLIGIITSIIAILYFALNLYADIIARSNSPELLFIFAWISIGIVLNVYSSLKSRGMSPEEEEFNVFGGYSPRKGGID